VFVEVSSIIYADITKIWHNYRIEKMILFLHCNICIWMPSWLKSHVAGLRWPELTEVPSLVSALTIQIYTTYQAIFLSRTPHTVSFKETQCQAFYAVCKSHSLEQLASNIFLNFLSFFFFSWGKQCLNWNQSLFFYFSFWVQQMFLNGTSEGKDWLKLHVFDSSFNTEVLNKHDSAPRRHRVTFGDIFDCQN